MGLRVAHLTARFALWARVSKVPDSASTRTVTISDAEVSYEDRIGGEAVNETARALLVQIEWNRKERPRGALPIVLANPAAYERRRGSNLTLLAEGGV